MIISRKDAWTLSGKTKTTNIVIGQSVAIDGITIDGPGEYDIAGVAVRGISTPVQTIYAIDIEDMRLAVIPRYVEELSTELVEQIGDVDVAVVPFVASVSMTDTMGLVNRLEPKMAIVIGDGDFASIPQGASTIILGDSLKITKSSLPLEDRVIILANA